MLLAGAQGRPSSTQDRCWLPGRDAGRGAGQGAVRNGCPTHHAGGRVRNRRAAAGLSRGAGLCRQGERPLAISISKVHASYVLWFRPEVVQTVKWGGDPQKRSQEEAGSIRLHPRAFLRDLEGDGARALAALGARARSRRSRNCATPSSASCCAGPRSWRRSAEELRAQQQGTRGLLLFGLA